MSRIRPDRKFSILASPSCWPRLLCCCSRKAKLFLLAKVESRINVTVGDLYYPRNNLQNAIRSLMAFLLGAFSARGGLICAGSIRTRQLRGIAQSIPHRAAPIRFKVLGKGLTLLVVGLHQWPSRRAKQSHRGAKLPDNLQADRLVKIHNGQSSVRTGTVSGY